MSSQKARQDRYRATEKGKATRKRCFDEWVDRNREERNAYMRRWWAKERERNPHKVKRDSRRSRLKLRYNITPEQYDALLLAQGGKCALCNKRPEDERTGYLHVDHCHETGRVRGLLCNSHNLALGRLGDNVLGLMRALAYLCGN